jgi:ATP-binding cassette subfamily F protein uup
MLARLFTRAANVLVLDEPTNDLDLQTLERLETQLLEFPGTLLLVSHDRMFLDNTVTSTLVFEGNGRVQEYVGGYEDWLLQRPQAADEAVARKRVREVHAARPAERKKLSYREQRELELLPGRIDKLEKEQRDLNAAVSDPTFYLESPETIRARLARLEGVETELLEAYALWDDLESRSR